MRRVYRYLDVPNHEELSARMYDLFRRAGSKLGWTGVDVGRIHAEIPELIEAFDRIKPGLELSGFFFISLKPRVVSPIHIDYLEPLYRILWPVMNCEGSETRFFDCNSNDIRYNRSWGYGSADRPAYAVDDDRIGPLMDTVRLTRPVVFDPTILHGVWPNPDIDQPRVSATMFFKQPLDDLLFGQ